MAMEELAKIDQVAYVRFASVYKSFKDVSEFTQVIAECKRQIRPSETMFAALDTQ